jgi:large subunit ribosomal protein L7/L12
MLPRRLFSASLEGATRIQNAKAMLLDLKLPELIKLVEELQKDLNISPTTSVMMNAPAPVAAGEVKTAPAAKKEEKAEVNVILQKIDPTNKAKLIREIKVLMPNLNLVEAKTFVESAPKLIKEKVKSEEANSIKATLEALGAQISFE